MNRKIASQKNREEAFTRPGSGVATLLPRVLVVVLIICMILTIWPAIASVGHDVGGIYNGNGNNSGMNDGNYSPSNSCAGVDNCNGNSDPNSGPIPTSYSPILEGDFLGSPGPITGPAIVEYWNGQEGANKVCGTFQLPSGEFFRYSGAGHWWKYESDQDMQAEWPLYLALYNKSPKNAGCTIGRGPPP